MGKPIYSEMNEEHQHSGDNISRPLIGVLLVVASFLPDRFDVQCYKILRNSYYKCPEAFADSWQEISNLIRRYLAEEGLTGDSEEDYPEQVQLMGNIFADRVDYRKYLKIEGLPPTMNREVFLSLIKENRTWLGFA